MILLANGRVITRDPDGVGYLKDGGVVTDGAKIVEVDDQSASQHWNIMVAILANDPDRAEQAMRSHMQYVTRLYSRELDRGHL